MRLIPVCLCLAALLLAGCANSNVNGRQNAFGGAPPRPKAVLVSDFVVASDVVVIDRSFTARLERKIGTFPTYERKQRTLERVNDEIVATIIATVREAGLDAQPGSEESLKLNDDALVVSGRLRLPDGSSVAKDQIGIGAGRSAVVADVTLSRVSGRGKKQLVTFATDTPSGRKTGAATSAKMAAAQNAAIAEALAAEKAASEKLSADVEAQARKLGRAAGEKILAYAKEQGWLETAVAVQATAEEKPVKLPQARPEKKPDNPAT
jgi:hypothetical protein